VVEAGLSRYDIATMNPFIHSKGSTMTYRTPTLIVTGLILTAGLMVGCGEEDKPASPETQAAAFRAIIEGNVQALNDKKIDALLASFHPKSPEAAQTRQVLQQVFAQLDLEYELLSLKLIGQSDDVATVRVRQKTIKKKPDQRYLDNVTDAIYIFRRHDDQWTVWKTVAMNVELLEKPQAQATARSAGGTMIIQPPSAAGGQVPTTTTSTAPVGAP
jgi:hypothetical protein